MTAPTNTISIDLGIYELQLRNEIASDLTTLQIVFDAISEKRYVHKPYILKQHFTVAEISVAPVEFLERREINKCFKSIMGSMQDYMDKLIAVQRLVGEPITLPSTTTQESISKLLEEKFTRHLFEVSTDRSLNVPRKLTTILDKPDQQVIRDSLQSYFDVRNGLEHHKGVAKAARTVRYKRIALASSAGYEIEKPGPLGENEGVAVTAFDEEILYDKGGALLISRQQLESIVLSLLIFVIPAIQNTVAGKFGARPSPQQG